MERKDDYEILRRGGFAEVEMKKLSQLRKQYTEQEKFQEMANYRRLEFVRWLVSTGRLTDQLV
ncbi:MAG: hypothetical protein JO125_08670 [Chloroflexi bacterium]|nr:hypothetical protein [Ktedonobacteraceae bacterium]MBV9707464.1 hypothetical protein [Chloroflexota bacterium]